MGVRVRGRVMVEVCSLTALLAVRTTKFMLQVLTVLPSRSRTVGAHPGARVVSSDLAAPILDVVHREFFLMVDSTQRWWQPPALRFDCDCKLHFFDCRLCIFCS